MPSDNPFDVFAGKRVAVVGNAESLFQRSVGEEIDVHDCVVRINKAAMLWGCFDARASHGERADAWAFWDTGQYKLKFERAKKDHPGLKLFHMGPAGRQHTQNMALVDYLFPRAELLRIQARSIGLKNPSTGFMTLWWVAKCEPASVDVYGFDWKRSPTWTDPTRELDPGCPHDFERERELCGSVFPGFKFH